MIRILVVEDDSDIALSLRYNLARAGGFRVETERDGAAAFRRVVHEPPDLLLLDLGLPGMDGIDVCRRLRARKETAALPIIALTARVEEADRVRGLDSGADDYVTKPFSVQELLARVRAVLRRSGPREGDRELTAGPLRLDRAARSVTVAGDEVRLTRLEFDLLWHLVSRRGLVCSRSALLEQVWGYTYAGASRTVDVHVRQLRKKLGAEADGWIETVVGVGYRLRKEE